MSPLKKCLVLLLPSFILSMSVESAEAHMPEGMGMNESTTCEEFTRTARFNPYSVLRVWWFMFYYWAEPRTVDMFYFYVPTSNQLKNISLILDGRVTVPVNWTARRVLMTTRDHITSLLVERSDRGEYWMYDLANSESDDLMTPSDVRFKQIGDNELIGVMHCDSETAYILSKLRNVPRKKDIPDAVARVGYRGGRGRSYLYQGNDWMPIAEMDEMAYWMSSRLKSKLQYRLKNP